jgi:hypothetical protein
MKQAIALVLVSTLAFASSAVVFADQDTSSSNPDAAAKMQMNDDAKKAMDDANTTMQAKPAQQ